MSSNIISDSQFQHIAKLARLPLKPEDEIIKDQLSEATNYVAILDELDTSKVLPTSQVNHKQNVLREDIIKDSFSQKVALSEAKDVQGGYFKTAATIKK